MFPLFAPWSCRGDVTQVVNSRYCVLVLSILAVAHVVIVAVYFKDPVQCFCPAHFTEPHCDVMKTHCAVTLGSSHVLHEGFIPDYREPITTSVPAYYHFVSLILLLQALLFYLPSFVWKELASNIGIMPEDFASLSADARCCKSVSEREFLIRNSARHLEIFCTRQLRKRHLSYFTKYFHGSKLVIAKFFSKILYGANVIGQFYLLDVFLQMPFHQLGWKFFNRFTMSANIPDVTIDFDNNSTDIDVEISWSKMIFEVNHICSLSIRSMGNLQRYSIQCFYYVNALNEFIFTFVWFLLLAAAVVTITSLMFELFKMLAFPCRRMGIRERLQDIGVLARNDPRDTDIVKKINRFEKLFLQRDGLLLMSFIEKAAGDVLADEILGELWKSYDSNYDELEVIFRPVKWMEETEGESEQVQEQRPLPRTYSREPATVTIPMLSREECVAPEAPPAYQEVAEKES